MIIRFGKPYIPSLASSIEVLLQARRPDGSRALTARERRVDAVAAAGFVLAAAGLVAWRGHAPASVGQAVALVATYAALARVLFAVGSGFTVPTQLALVPMLLLLPPAIVPALVGAALVLAYVPELVEHKARAERVLTNLADGWYVAPPALLLALVAPHGAIDGAGWPLWIAALALQLVSDWIASTLRVSLGSGVAPSLQAGVVAQIAVVDILLSAIGLLAAFGSQVHRYAFLLTVPLVAGFQVFARDRAARIARAFQLVDDLDRERQRVVAAQRRIGETAAANLDRSALERIIVETAVELIDVDVGSLSAREDPSAPHRSHTVCGDLHGLDEVLSAVESELARRDGLAEAKAGETAAIGLALACRDEPGRALAVARRQGTFGERERELLLTLAEEAAVCLQNLALHERVQRLAATDDLTGLLNHRRLREVLEREVRRASRYGTPLALAMLDVDNFKHVNDRHGHQQGDRVLRAVADVLRGSVREVDCAARYGGEELAVVLPQMGLEGAEAVAERMRVAIAGIRVPTPDGETLSVTTSVGVAAIDGGSLEYEDLIALADAALYQAKRTGKNRVVVYDAPRAAHP